MALPMLSLLPSRLSRTSWCHSQGRAAKALSVYHQKNYGGHSYGCLMALLPEEARKEITDWCLENIADFHLAPEGRELTPHVTIKYGFTDNNDTTVSTLQAITQANGPIYLTIQGLRTFPEGKDGVPLVLDVDSPQLNALNSHISEVVECVDTHPDYIPHITLAYLTQEAAGLYLEESPPFVGKSVVCDTVEWTGSDDRRVSFSLGILPTFGQKAAPPQANKDTKVATGTNTKVSGTRKDSLGRERCYQDGVMVPCNKPEEGGQQEQGQTNPEDPELAKQGSQVLDASSQEAPAAAETPEEKAQFNAEWDKAIQDQLPDIQAANVIDHDYSPEEVAAEQNWHAEFIEWRFGLLTGGREGDKFGEGQWDNRTRFEIQPADASKVARFVSGLLNPLMGGVDYVINLLDKWLGGSPKESQVDPAIGDELQAYFDQISPNNEANKPVAQLVAQVVGEQALPVVKAMAGGGLEEGHRNRWVNTQLAAPKKPKQTQLADEAPDDEVITQEPAKDAKPEEKADTYYQGLMSNLTSHGITPEKHDPRINFEELKGKVAGLVKAGLDHDDILEAVQKFADRSIGLSSPGGKGAKKKGPSLKPSRIKAPTVEERAAAGQASIPAKAGAQERVAKAKAKVEGTERNRAAMTAEERQAKQEEAAEKSKQRGSKRKEKSAQFWSNKYKNELRSTERELKEAKRAGDEKETARLERVLDRRVSEIQDEFKREGYGEFTYQPKKKSLPWYQTKEKSLENYHHKDLSWLNTNSGGALVRPAATSLRPTRLMRNKGLLDTPARYLADKWNYLEQRYGRVQAIAMLGAMLATLPLPGNIAAVIAAGEAARYFRSAPPSVGELGKSINNHHTKEWITIGGKPCKDGEGQHCGGTPVEISKTGKIRKGPASMIGLKPSQLSRRRNNQAKPKTPAPKQPTRTEQPTQAKPAAQAKPTAAQTPKPSPKPEPKEETAKSGGKRPGTRSMSDEQLNRALQRVMGTDLSFMPRDSREKIYEANVSEAQEEKEKREAKPEKKSDGGILKKVAKKPNAKVSMGTGQAMQQKKEAIKQMFGKDIDEKTLAAIANGVDGAKIEIDSSMPSSSNKYIQLKFTHEGVRADRTIEKDRYGKTRAHNNLFTISETSKYRGKGVEFFASQVAAMQEAGVDYIETHAAGSAINGTFNGYYTWPRMGYDAELEPEQLNHLPKSLTSQLGGKKNIQSLFALPGGKEAWEIFGNDLMEAKFDLSKGSQSIQALESYLKEREQAAAKPKEEQAQIKERVKNARKKMKEFRRMNPMGQMSDQQKEELLKTYIQERGSED